VQTQKSFIIVEIPVSTILKEWTSHLKDPNLTFLNTEFSDSNSDNMETTALGCIFAERESVLQRRE
jgi:hypothetical protein